MRGIEPFYQELGRRIQTFRKERNMTQEELGDRLDPEMTRAGIANIEAGKQRVLSHTLVQLAEALDKTASDLIPPSQKKDPVNVKEVEAELAQKLDLPKKELKKLTEKLNTAKRRSKR